MINFSDQVKISSNPFRYNSSWLIYKNFSIFTYKTSNLKAYTFNLYIEKTRQFINWHFA